MKTLRPIVQLATCCFLLGMSAINGNSQQPVTTSGSYMYSSRGIGFKQGTSGIDVYQIKTGEQIGVVKAGGGQVKFNKFDGVTDAQVQTVNDAIQDYQLHRLNPASDEGIKVPNASIGGNPTGGVPQPQSAPANAADGFKASNGYVVSFGTAPAENTTAIIVTAPVAGPRGSRVEFDFSQSGSRSGTVGRTAWGVLGAGVGQGKITNAKGDIVTVNDGVKTVNSFGNVKGSSINTDAFRPQLNAIDEAVNAGAGSTGFDLKRFHKVMGD